MDNGVTIHTSGTSGTPKAIWQSPEKIKANNEAAIRVQHITPQSKIYTCLNLEKAGGLFAQTIPALSIGASVYCDKFSPYEYVRQAHKYTHTHLTPLQAKGVMSTKRFKSLDLTGKTFMCGSEPVTYDIIEAFINQGAKFVGIWGMTEVGPNAIMYVLDSIEEVRAIKSLAPPNTTLLGDIVNCDIKVIDGCLWVKGKLSTYDDWFNTQDEVVIDKKYIYYSGRKGTPVDFNRPRKG